MIIGIFINLYSWAIQLFRILPNWSIPEQFLAPVNLLVGFALSFEGLFPVRALFLCLGMILAFELSLWLLKIFTAGINFIRGTGSIEF